MYDLFLGIQRLKRPHTIYPFCCFDDISHGVAFVLGIVDEKII